MTAVDAPTQSRPIPAPARAPHGKLLLATLCAASALSVLNALALSPFLADMAPDMHVSVATMGQAGTLAGLVGATLGLVIGAVAESVGYRRLMVAGAAALVLATIGTALAPAYLPLMGAQLVGGLAGSTISPMAFAFAGTLYHDEARRRAITRIYAAASGAEIVVFPIITRVAAASSWRWAFATLAAGGATLVILALLAFPRDPAPPVRPQRVRALPGVYSVLVRERAMRLLYGAQFLRGVAWTGTLAYMGAFIDDELGYSVRAAGFALTVVGSGFLAGSLLVGGRLRRREPRLTFITATALMGALIGVMFLWRPGIGVTYGLLLLIAFCGGIAEVTAITMISAETPAAQAATMALHSSILRYGTSIGALAGGVLLALGGYRVLGGGLLLSAVAGAWTCTRRRW